MSQNSFKTNNNTTKTLILTFFLLMSTLTYSYGQTADVEYGTQVYTQSSHVYGLVGVGASFHSSDIAHSRIGVRYLHRDFDNHRVEIPLTTRSNTKFPITLGLVGAWDDETFALFTYGLGYTKNNTVISLSHNFSLSSEYYSHNSVNFVLSIKLR